MTEMSANASGFGTIAAIKGEVAAFLVLNEDMIHEIMSHSGEAEGALKERAVLVSHSCTGYGVQLQGWIHHMDQAMTDHLTSIQLVDAQHG